VREKHALTCVQIQALLDTLREPCRTMVLVGLLTGMPVGEILGLRSTTLEIYTLPVPDHQRAAVENLARMVTNGDEPEPCAKGLPEATQQIQ
jgi:hypothetical protein